MVCIQNGAHAPGSWREMKTLSLLILALGLVMGTVFITMAQTAPQPCEDQLTDEIFQAGLLKQQLAITRNQLRLMTKERDALTAATAKPK